MPLFQIKRSTEDQPALVEAGDALAALQAYVLSGRDAAYVTSLTRLHDAPVIRSGLAPAASTHEIPGVGPVTIPEPDANPQPETDEEAAERQSVADLVEALKASLAVAARRK